MVSVDNMSKFLDITGVRYGRLLVKSISDREVVKGNRFWNCICDCGCGVTVSGFHLKSGHTSSCGCIHRENLSTRKKTHGHTLNKTASPTYSSWSNMVKRCNNKNASNYERYGGRGIKVCDEWLFFENFLLHMGERPSIKHELDRRDNDGNYEPSNCRWVTASENSRNRRSCRFVDTLRGKMTITEAANIVGIGHAKMKRRINSGWPLDRILCATRD
jgi:hypothetical protein